ncbi:hypothetical protein JOB18_006692 [Solea senegalensis]|uniref:Uncharacterized protein n=1 Tax=Solea senegalensis TaxID=28829 RepID=A0AAV6PG49_SOLSE|nr:hypothetical protein JOB18_006692 [Solea senegalensis]
MAVPHSCIYPQSYRLDGGGGGRRGGGDTHYLAVTFTGLLVCPVLSSATSHLGVTEDAVSQKLSTRPQ